MKLITATGRELPCTWCGVSFMNNLFASVSGTFDELLKIFEDKSETSRLVFDDDGQQRIYEGYTVLTGLKSDPRTGYITVTLAKE